jgi:hypothetical protein
VCATTLGAAQDVSITFVSEVTPAPTVVALQHTRVHTGGPYSGGPASDVTLMVDEEHSPLAILRVCYGDAGPVLS